MAKTGGRMGRNIQYNDNMDSEEEVRSGEERGERSSLPYFVAVAPN